MKGSKAKMGLTVQGKDHSDNTGYRTLSNKHNIYIRINNPYFKESQYLTFLSWHSDSITVVSSKRKLLSRPCPKLSPSSNKKLGVKRKRKTNFNITTSISLCSLFSPLPPYSIELLSLYLYWHLISLQFHTFRDIILLCFCLLINIIYT